MILFKENKPLFLELSAEGALQKGKVFALN